MPTGFQLGPLYIHFYGIILMTGALVGGWIATIEARRREQDPEIVWDALIWVLIGGIIGARLWHVLTPPQSSVDQGITASWYLTHPLDALAIWRGGLGIPGAIIGGIIALYMFCKRKKLSFLIWADISAPGLALAQAIGRWGNFINQEVYGAPTNLPWGLHIDPQYRMSGFTQFETFHPLFLYESIWSLLNFATLIWAGRRYKDRLRSGDILLMYTIIYPVGRFFLEFLRLDAAYVGGINANQTLMGLVAIASAILLIWRHRQPLSTNPDTISNNRSEEASTETQGD